MILTELYLQNHLKTINSSKSINFLLYVIQNLIKSHQRIRIPHPSFRSVMVSVTFYDSIINVLDNLWQKHLKRNQIIEK